jgi:hypothetical protein
MKTIDKDQQAELIEAARTASEPIDWHRIAEYFANQRALVAPRETRDNPPDRGDS